MLKAVGGFISVCAYCGEQTTGKAKYCPTCKTQAGRKKIFDANLEIIKENKAKGFKTQEVLKSWK